jgi:hypothetical protein
MELASDVAAVRSDDGDRAGEGRAPETESGGPVVNPYMEDLIASKERGKVLVRSSVAIMASAEKSL